MTDLETTNPDPCGICGETCSYTTDGNRNHQCNIYGGLWRDDSPTGPAFVARLLGVERATVDKWLSRGVMPSESWPAEETGRRLWRRRTILDWAKATGRL